MSDSGDPAFLLRLAGDEVERQVFSRKMLFVGVQRSWHEGSKVFFSRKTESIVGSGIVSSVQLPSELGADEKEYCFLKNYCAKLHFKTVSRFHPPVPLQSTSIAGQNPIALHGSELGGSAVNDIESKITSSIVF